MPVHLTGRMADMDAISALASRHGLAVIEDAAQAMGSRFNDRHAGTIGTVGCFSTHPLKNLNAMGDGGFVVTQDAALADRLRRLRNNGLADRNTVTEWGVVSRLDNVQAAILRHRLDGLDDVVAARRNNAAHYRSLLDSRFEPRSAACRSRRLRPAALATSLWVTPESSRTARMRAPRSSDLSSLVDSGTDLVSDLALVVLDPT